MDKDKFIKFENLRLSGVINMFDITSGCEITGLSREDYTYIMKHYTELKEMFQ